MATDFFTFNYLVPRDFLMRGKTFEEAMTHFSDIAHLNNPLKDDDSDLELEEYYRRCEVTDPLTLDSVSNGSRKGWLLYALEQLSETAAIPGLRVLYGAEEFQYQWEAPEIFDDGNGRLVEWCRWKCVTLNNEKLVELTQEITRLFDWLREHIDDQTSAIFGDFSSQEELLENLQAPVLSRDTALDRRIWYAEDGDGPHCLFSYLHSVRQLCKNACSRDSGVLFIVQTPK